MDKMPTYCLDIYVGRSEQVREELIHFLEGSAPLSVKKAQRGMWQGVKILRVQTTDAEELQQILIDEFRMGDDCDYVAHYSAVDEQRSMTWLPDYDTKFDQEEFSFAFVHSDGE